MERVNTFLRQRYCLRVVEQDEAEKVAIRGEQFNLYICPKMSAVQRYKILQRWYQQQLKTIIPPLKEIVQRLLELGFSILGGTVHE